MEVDFQEQFRNSRPQRSTNEAAMFVENRIVLPQQQPPIYAEQLDQFVPLQEALRQQQIRYVYYGYGPCSSLTICQCRIMEERRRAED
jgi:hypothetical protein